MAKLEDIKYIGSKIVEFAVETLGLYIFVDGMIDKKLFQIIGGLTTYGAGRAGAWVIERNNLRDNVYSVVDRKIKKLKEIN